MHGTIQFTNKHQGAGYRPAVTVYGPGTGVGDSGAFRPLSSCCLCGGTLDRSGPTLSMSAIVLSLSTCACWSPPSPCAGVWAGLASSRGLLNGCTGVELLLCAPGGAVNVLTGRTGAPVWAPTLSVSAFVLFLSAGACWIPPSPCAGGWAGLTSSRGPLDGCTGVELLLCAPLTPLSKPLSNPPT